MRDQLMSTTQLVAKGRVLLSPDDIKFNMRNGENQILFFFPKTTPISLDKKDWIDPPAPLRYPDHWKG